jgi:hypothetical protein
MSSKAKAPPPHSKKLPHPQAMWHVLNKTSPTSAGGAIDISPARKCWVSFDTNRKPRRGDTLFPRIGANRCATRSSSPIRHAGQVGRSMPPPTFKYYLQCRRADISLYRYSSQNLGPSRPNNWQLLRISSVITRHEFSALHGGCVPGETCRHCSTNSRARSSPIDLRHSCPW